MVSFKLLAAVCVFALAAPAMGAMNCMDAKGEPIDWWIMLKNPIQDMFWPDEHMQDYGLNFGYIDSNNYSSWVADDHVFLNQTDTSFMQTLYQIYDADESNYMAMYYNDQPPYMPWSEYFAHSKGFIVADEESGFFLTHSAPHFPAFYQDSGKIELNLYYGSHYFGQHFGCFSMNTSELEKLSKDVKLNNPWVYKSNFPEKFVQEFPNLHTLSIVPDTSLKPKLPDYHGTDTFETKDGKQFTYFSHNGKAEHDFYEQFVEPGLDTGLMVQSWGRPWMPNFDPTVYGYKSTNIAFIYISRSQKFHWESDKDHSKWGVSYDEDKPYVCLCDMNRMTSQRVRGGGASCFRDAQLWSRFHEIAKWIAPAEPEPKGYDPAHGGKTQEFDISTPDDVVLAAY